MRRTSARFFRTFASAVVLVCVSSPLADAATVAGRVLDTTTSLPLSGVEVLVDGMPTGVTTDFMGAFRTDVAAGEHLFTFRRAGYSEQSQGPLAVAEDGETAVPDAKLAPLSADDEVVMLDAILVESSVVKGSAGDLQNVRAKADIAIDFLSADQLAKFSAGDLSEALIRIPGISVANGQFAVVRGLSDRYLTTTVHGLKLPSPDPEKQAFQMDLLPASAIGNVVVAKSYGPELWGESGGGNIDIVTTAVPEENFVKAGVGMKFNSNALDGGPDYEVDGRGERFGFGAENRPTPGESVSDIPPADWQYVPTRRDSFPVGANFGVESGFVFPVRGNRLGVLFSAENESDTKVKNGSTQDFGVRVSDGISTPSGFEDPSIPLVRGTYYDVSESETESVTNLSGTIAYRFAETHEIKLTGLFVQSGIDVAQLRQNAYGLDDNLALTTIDGEFVSGVPDTGRVWIKGYEYYRERNLTSVQLSGDHEWDQLGGLRMSWAGQHASAYQNESPYIETAFATPLTDPFVTYVIPRETGAPAPLRIVTADNEETQDTARLDFEVPRDLFAGQESVLRFGAAFDEAERNVDGAARFYRNPANDIIASDPNGLYQDLVSDPANLNDFYTTESSASREINAAYLGATLAPTKWVKLTGGLRLEDASLRSSGVGQWGNLTSEGFYTDGVGGGQFGNILGTDTYSQADYSSRDVLPALGLIFQPSRTTAVRLHYSETLGRPSLREISPFFNKSIETGNLVVGNPALVPSEVTSYDLRLEWNPSPENGVAVSFFNKEIDRPIEKMLFNTESITGEFTESWVNNPNTADLRGVELEFRHSLAGWSEMLRDFSLNGNFTYIDAEVEEHPIVLADASQQFLDPDQVARTRRLYDQPEYIVNADVTWRKPSWGTSATLAAYAISDVLVATGLQSFTYDLYTRSHIRYDFIFSQRFAERFVFKFSVKNLFDPVLGTVYDRDALGDTVARTRYRAGRDFSISLSAEF